MSLGRLRTGEWLVVAAAIVLVVALFALHWYGGVDPRDGWRAVPALRWLILVTVTVALVTALTQVRPGPGLSAALDVVALVLSSLTLVLLAIRLATTGATLAVGAFVGLTASIALVTGIFLALRTEQGRPADPAHPIEVVGAGGSDRCSRPAADPETA
jgi:hypothetical protein